MGTTHRGANVADTAYPLMLSNLLKNNSEIVMECMKLITRDLGYSYGEMEDGQHTDGSYRFHYYYAMNGTYSVSFMNAAVPIINIMNDTKFEITD